MSSRRSLRKRKGITETSQKKGTNDTNSNGDITPRKKQKIEKKDKLNTKKRTLRRKPVQKNITEEVKKPEPKNDTKIEEEEEEDVCGICLDKTKLRGVLDSCDHICKWLIFDALMFFDPFNIMFFYFSRFLELFWSGNVLLFVLFNAPSPVKKFFRARCSKNVYCRFFPSLL